MTLLYFRNGVCGWSGAQTEHVGCDLHNKAFRHEVGGSEEVEYNLYGFEVKGMYMQSVAVRVVPNFLYIHCLAIQTAETCR
jgi:hypothetical protein